MHTNKLICFQLYLDGVDSDFWINCNKCKANLKYDKTEKAYSYEIDFFYLSLNLINMP